MTDIPRFETPQEIPAPADQPPSYYAPGGDAPYRARIGSSDQPEADIVASDADWDFAADSPGETETSDVPVLQEPTFIDTEPDDAAKTRAETAGRLGGSATEAALTAETAGSGEDALAVEVADGGTEMPEGVLGGDAEARQADVPVSDAQNVQVDGAAGTADDIGIEETTSDGDDADAGSGDAVAPGTSDAGPVSEEPIEDADADADPEPDRDGAVMPEAVEPPEPLETPPEPPETVEPAEALPAPEAADLTPLEAAGQSSPEAALPSDAELEELSVRVEKDMDNIRKQAQQFTKYADRAALDDLDEEIRRQAAPQNPFQPRPAALPYYSPSTGTAWGASLKSPAWWARGLKRFSIVMGGALATPFLALFTEIPKDGVTQIGSMQYRVTIHANGKIRTETVRATSETVARVKARLLGAHHAF